MILAKACKYTHTGKNISLLTMLKNEEMESFEKIVIANMRRDACYNRQLFKTHAKV